MYQFRPRTLCQTHVFCPRYHVLNAARSLLTRVRSRACRFLLSMTSGYRREHVRGCYVRARACRAPKAGGRDHQARGRHRLDPGLFPQNKCSARREREQAGHVFQMFLRLGCCLLLSPSPHEPHYNFGARVCSRELSVHEQTAAAELAAYGRLVRAGACMYISV